MTSHWSKINPTRAEMIEQLRARRAPRVAAGDPVAIMLQAAHDRAAAEQLEHDRRELDRLRRLLDLPDTAPQRKRKASLVTVVKRLRSAGEHGPVRVELGDGTVVTSSREGAPGEMTVSDAERMWLERIGGKNAAH
jgi:hypothetical protein